MQPSESQSQIVVRRISWADFYRLRPDLRPANDDEPNEKKEVNLD